MSYEGLSKDELIKKIAVLEEKQQRATVVARKWQQKNHSLRLHNVCKQNAARKGLEFNIDPEDIVIPEVCMYTGLPITNILGEGRVKTNASVDRIDNSKGYIKGNIRVISDLANKMKHNATVEELVLFAKGVLRLHDRT